MDPTPTPNPNPPLRRVALDDVLPGLLGPGDHALAAHDVKALDALRRVGVALDQVVNRAHAEQVRFGRADGPDSPANRDDLAEARRLVRVLELGADAGNALIAGLLAQFPAPAEAPKKAGNGK